MGPALQRTIRWLGARVPDGRRLATAVRRGEVLATWRVATMWTIAWRVGLWLLLGWRLADAPLTLVPLWLRGLLGVLFLPAAILSVRIIAEGLQLAALPRVGLIAAAAATDILVTLAVYVAGDLQPVPDLLMSLGVLAGHGALLPMFMSVGLAVALASGVLGLQVLATLQNPAGGVLVLSSTGLAVTLVGMGVGLGIFGTWLRRLAVLQIQSAQRLEGVGRRADLLQTELPIACLWFDADGQIRRLEGSLEPVAGSWAPVLQSDRALQQLLTSPPPPSGARHQGEIRWPADTSIAPLQVLSWTLTSYPFRDAPPETAAPVGATLAELGARSSLPTQWRWFLVLQDRTPSAREAQLRTALQHAQDTAWLSAGLAHELRTPLGVIQTCAEQLATEGPEAPQGADRALLRDLLQREITRLSTYVGDVLAYARLPEHAGPTAPVSVILDQTRQRLETQPAGPGGPFRLQLTTLGEPSVPMEPLQLALTNLLANAQQHSPPGHGIRCISEPTPTPGIWLIRIIDGGPGLPSALAERLLRPYATMRPGGTGLGLPLAARAVALLGGELTFAPRPGGQDGVDPCILLPYTLPPDLAPAPAPPPLGEGLGR